MASKNLRSDPASVSNALDATQVTDLITCPLVEFYRAEGYKPDDSIGYLMRRIIALISQGEERELEPQGLTNAQWVPQLKR